MKKPYVLYAIGSVPYDGFMYVLVSNKTTFYKELQQNNAAVLKIYYVQYFERKLDALYCFDNIKDNNKNVRNWYEISIEKMGRYFKSFETLKQGLPQCLNPKYSIREMEHTGLDPPTNNSECSADMLTQTLQALKAYPEEDKKSTIGLYAIGMKNYNGLVKIGYSRTIDSTFIEMRNQSRAPLYLLGRLGYKTNVTASRALKTLTFALQTCKYRGRWYKLNLKQIEAIFGKRPTQPRTKTRFKF